MKSGARGFEQDEARRLSVQFYAEPPDDTTGGTANL